MRLDDIALEYVKKNERQFCDLSKDIWEHPELGLHETYAAGLLADALEKANFTIEKNIGGMPTAFTATWGEGRPIIGVLGEYDALPGLSQKASSIKEPMETGGPGHGCGHNQLGVGAMAAAMTANATMEKEGIKGTIVYYGCPAEETLVGKVFMARAGVFDDLDAAITWHPMTVNTTWEGGATALNSFKLNFYGRSAHAGVSPEAGRSALDGVVLTDVGVNYLREHVASTTRIHCVITKGGEAPNVVPDYAQVWYYVRAPRRDQVEEVYARLLDIAKGAALMSGTRVETEFITGCYDFLSNDILAQMLMEKMKQVGPPQYTEEEKVFASELVESVDPTIVENQLQSFKLSREEVGFPLCDKILEEVGGLGKNDKEGGSTDVGDVSYCVPTAQLCTACSPVGIPGHSWQYAASQGTSIGLKGMLFAAKALSLSLLELIQNPEVLKAAREEFIQATGGKKYVSPLPDGLEPPLGAS